MSTASRYPISNHSHNLSHTKLRALGNQSSLVKVGEGSTLPPLDYHSKSSTKLTADKKSNSRTLLRSTGKYAMSMSSGSALDHVLTKSGFSSTMGDLSKPFSMMSRNGGAGGLPPPAREVGVITLDELEGIKLRAVGINERTIDVMERTKNKIELHQKSLARKSNWNDTSEKYLERRRAE
jgi:hypothetical protein